MNISYEMNPPKIKRNTTFDLDLLKQKVLLVRANDDVDSTKSDFDLLEQEVKLITAKSNTD